MGIASWFNLKSPKKNPSAPAWTGGVCTLNTHMLSAYSLDELEKKVNGFASSHMVAGIDIRKDSEGGSGSVDAFEKAAGIKKTIWFAQVNYWVVM